MTKTHFQTSIYKNIIKVSLLCVLCLFNMGKTQFFLLFCAAVSTVLGRGIRNQVNEIKSVFCHSILCLIMK